MHYMLMSKVITVCQVLVECGISHQPCSLMSVKGYGDAENTKAVHAILKETKSIQSSQLEVFFFHCILVETPVLEFV